MEVIHMKWLSMLLVAGLASTLTAPAAWSWGINPPGPKGGPGHGKYWRYNPPGKKGGPGKGWIYNPPGPGKVRYTTANKGHINPPGPKGGVGHGPFWRYKLYNPPGPGKVYF